MESDECVQIVLAWLLRGEGGARVGVLMDDDTNGVLMARLSLAYLSVCRVYLAYLEDDSRPVKAIQIRLTSVREATLALDKPIVWRVFQASSKLKRNMPSSQSDGEDQ